MSLSPKEIEELKSIEVDPCPWCPDTKPGWSVHLGGHRDEPYVYIRAQCPKCRCQRTFAPTEKDVQKHYKSRYSENRELIIALWPRLIKMWNWKGRQK